jgi:branched-chain amino acid transport system substrate-binding protein
MRAGGFSLVAGCVLALAVAIGGKLAVAQDDVIKIGMTNSFSGGLAQAASPVWRGVMVWQDWVNAQGGITVKDRNKKMPVRVIYHDDETNRENLIRLYERLATSDNVDFFFAPYGSGQTFVVAGLGDKYKKFMVSTSGAAPNIYQQGYKYIIQGIMQADQFGRPYLDMLAKVDPNNKRIAMVYEDHLFPKSVATLVKDVAEKLGFQVVLFDRFPAGAQDVSAVLTRVKQLNPDHIYFRANIEGSIIGLRQMSELKVRARSIGILDNGMYYYKQALGGKTLDGIMGPVEWDMSQRYKGITLGPNNDEFMALHRKRFPGIEPDNHTPLGTNAGLILQRAIEQAGTLDSVKVRQQFCTMKLTTLMGPQAWDCETGLMKYPQDGGMPSIVTQWREDATTVTVWPPEFGDLKLLKFPVNKF